MIKRGKERKTEEGEENHNQKREKQGGGRHREERREKGGKEGTLGNRLGDEFRVNDLELGDQEAPAVAVAADGRYVVVWHKSLLSKLPSFGFYPSLCTFISSFLFFCFSLCSFFP